MRRRDQVFLALCTLLVGGFAVAGGAAWLWTSPDLENLGRELGSGLVVREGDTADEACQRLFEETRDSGSFPGYKWDFLDRRGFVRNCRVAVHDRTATRD
ncbi:hypothetical protein [Marmoricola sp. RAF53]|uniref:hypothetical protein n=1 Tax=Marmoricola sp. RAF53 TaxID=3233059 RepID=UPI003F9EAB2E